MSIVEADAVRNRDEFQALAAGRHKDPFALLGLHNSGGRRVVRTFQPQAKSVTLVDADGEELAAMQCVHSDGLFIAEMPARKRRYLLRVTNRGGDSSVVEDC